TAYNAVAEEAVLEGTTRTITPETRKQLAEQLTETAQSIAALYGGSAEVEWQHISSALYNDAQVCAEVRTLGAAALPHIHFVDDRPFSLAGDNFAEFNLEKPGAYLFLGTWDPDRPETHNSIHNNRFNLDESVLSSGAAIYAAYAHWWLTEGREKALGEND
ncbi:MAG: amidohydrolase, partial [Oscillospiraceae bacterium]|nr:amidohydrolase [Oscillospiraceae bacterium]